MRRTGRFHPRSAFSPFPIGARGLLRRLAIACVPIAAFLVMADDGIDLTVTPGPAPGEVLLQWTGGAPPFGVRRSPDPAQVGDPANELGQTPGNEWVDGPPPLEPILYYTVLSLNTGCPPGETLCPTGCVNTSNDPGNCGGCGISCDDGDPCTNDLCAGGDCRYVDRHLCVYDDPNNMNPEDVIRCGPSGCGPCNFASSLPACPSADSDNDGLSDVWESNGWIDLNCDGNNDPNVDAALPAGDPRVEDVYLKLSAMMNAPTETIPDVHVPSEEAIRRAVAAFGGSHLTATPVRCDASSPPGACPPGHACSIDDYVCLPACLDDSGCATGVCSGGLCRQRRLHVDPAAINLVPHANVIFMGPVQTACITGGAATEGVNFYDLKNDPANFDSKGALFTHFGIFAHFNSCDSATTCADPGCTGVTGQPADFTASGLAEFMGNDIVVTLGALPLSPPPDPIVKVLRDGGAILHELGHNLGLHHGGPFCDPTTDPTCAADPNQSYQQLEKNNYISVMNYTYNFGIPVAEVPGSTIPSSDPNTTRLDFSHVSLTTLYEGCLDEAMGVGPAQPPAYQTDLIKYLDPASGPFVRYGSTMPGQPIDWRFNGFPFESCVQVDINNSSPGLPPEVMPGAQDWGYLRYAFQCDTTFVDGSSPPEALRGTGAVEAEPEPKTRAGVSPPGTCGSTLSRRLASGGSFGGRDVIGGSPAPPGACAPR